MERTIFTIFWLLLGAFFLFVACQIVFENSFSFSAANIDSSLLEVKSQNITLMAVGDIMLGRGVEYWVNIYGQGDFRFPFQKIVQHLGQADILFGNLEGPISENGQRVGSIYSFRFSPKVLDGLSFAGFDILSLANNHMLDYQAKALEDTMNSLREKGIDYIGAGFSEAEAFGLKIKEIHPIKSAEGGVPTVSEQFNRAGGVKIGFLGFTNLGPETWKATQDRTGMAWIGWDDFERIKEIILQSKSQVDVLVVSLHAGQEYSQVPDDFQKEFSKMAINSGADLIIGHHSHVVQLLEKYQNSWIAYSLGNFVFDQFFSKATMESAILRVEIQGKKISNVVLEKVKLNKYYQPELIN